MIFLNFLSHSSGRIGPWGRLPSNTMPEQERKRIHGELSQLESERLRLARELSATANGPEAVYLSAQIIRHRITLALMRSRLVGHEA